MARDETKPKKSIRSDFEFEAAVRERFGFLTVLGFTEIESSPTLVRFERGELAANVYHGRQSFELGFEIERKERLYSLEKLLRASRPDNIPAYRPYQAVTRDGVRLGLDEVARLVKQHATPALQVGGDVVFERMERQTQEWLDNYSLDVLAEQVRPQAEQAFRAKDFGRAAELYTSIDGALSPAERKKLVYAKAQARV